AFDALTPGKHGVSLNGTREVHQAIAQDGKDVEVDDGATTTVALSAPPSGPVHLRVHAEGTVDYSCWRARDGTYVSSAWSDLTAEGVMSQDASAMSWLEVESADASKWRVRLTPAVFAANVVELRVSDVGYRGRVLDRAT